MNTKVYGRHSKKFGGKKDCNDRIEIQRTDGEGVDTKALLDSIVDAPST